MTRDCSAIRRSKAKSVILALMSKMHSTSPKAQKVSGWPASVPHGRKPANSAALRPFQS
jgi:hypothetical protein